jgi:acyl-CoA hydrolase
VQRSTAFIEDGMTVGMSGFTRAGEAKLYLWHWLNVQTQIL